MRLLKIGRDTGCDIVLSHPSISSLHAEITLTDSGDIMLEDKGSLNGTFVMDQRIKPGKAVKVTRGDKISFANIELPWGKVPMPEDNSAYKAIIGIGKHFSNDIQVSGATVSRYHATIKVGKDGKVYIVDHSKNGTTVNGSKIPKDTPYRITRNSIVACGGVPVDIKNHPLITRYWGNNWWKYVAGIAATLVIAGIVYWCWPRPNSEWTLARINKRYNSSTVMLIGIYHYEVDCEDFPRELLNLLDIPTKFYFVTDPKNPIQEVGEETKISSIENISHYEASGFFVSNDGKILTNLHVAKPWLFDGLLEKVERYCQKRFAKKIEEMNRDGVHLGWSAYIQKLKIKGVSDGIVLIPQGAFFSTENVTKCHTIYAGDDINEDVALIQSDKQALPPRCTFVNVTDSLEDSDKAIEVGEKMFTIGFPHGTDLQELNSKDGIQALAHEGNISMRTEYGFRFDATSYHGASGSPIFNKYGKLIGILDSGIEKENINGGIQAKYIRKILESQNKK